MKNSFLIALSLLTVSWHPIGHADALGCLMEPSQVVAVGSAVVGVLDRVEVERGQLIAKGQLIAQLTAQVEQAAVALAEARAQNQAELQAAASTEVFAQRKHLRSDSLYKENFISPQLQEQAATEAALAKMKRLQAQEQKRLANQELSLARAQLAQRSIKSPISGVVVERYLSQGERVEEKPIAKVVALDPLHVEVILPAAEFNQFKPGMSALVTPQLQDTQPRRATVTLVDRVIDAASNTFRVRLSLPNPDHALPAGLRCQVAIGDRAPEKKSSVPSAARHPLASTNNTATARTVTQPTPMKLSKRLMSSTQTTKSEPLPKQKLSSAQGDH